MGGGGDHGLYPKGVWAPSGGWWADPKYWRRNTFLAFAGVIAVSIPIFMKSVELEKRPIPPVRHIPSQYWSPTKNFGKVNPNALGGQA